MRDQCEGGQRQDPLICVAVLDWMFPYVSVRNKFKSDDIFFHLYIPSFDQRNANHLNRIIFSSHATSSDDEVSCARQLRYSATFEYPI
jgi:hypothetical protein